MRRQGRQRLHRFALERHGWIVYTNEGISGTVDGGDEVLRQVAAYASATTFDIVTTDKKGIHHSPDIADAAAFQSGCSGQDTSNNSNFQHWKTDRETLVTLTFTSAGTATVTNIECDSLLPSVAMRFCVCCKRSDA